LQIRGFIVSTHADMLPDFQRDMVTWITGGQMKFEETVMEGIDNAPNAFMGLFSGQNKGKMLVKLS
ncbi:MAG: NADP-dependent oxidoreductase, partial [Pseudomonadota bacterium]